MGNTTVPVLLIFTVLAALVVLRATFPNATLVWESEYLDLTPVPDNGTVLAPPPAAIEICAVFEPVLVGMNVTWIAQLAPTGTDVPQPLTRSNWPGFVPVIATEVIGNGALPVFCRVMSFELEARFRACLSNASDVEESV